ncbi:MAG TPA: ComEA family DNA-binding protein [Pseudolysinimonas sp.]|jgi:competence protein ComEA|nr:ComEA family DNA-binding protein [Pseudolysinimonas sp.]
MSAAPVPDPRRARLRVGAGAALVLALVGAGVAVLLTAVTPHGSSATIAPPGPRPGATSQATPDAGDGSVIYVHILGQVEQPGLYSLHDGDRAVDIVAAAGGFTPQADTAAINLARFLSDGEQIIVPAVGEAVSGSGSAAGATTPDAKVNLNTADATALETLPRIGPAMAQRIIDWRDKNGPFSAVEDLLAVPGIGNATFEGLRDLVAV